MKYLLQRLRTGRPVECLRVAEHLQAYVDGETDSLTASEIQEHLDVCRDCGLDADAYFQLKVSLGRRVQVEPDVAERLRRFVDDLTGEHLTGDGPG